MALAALDTQGSEGNLIFLKVILQLKTPDQLFVSHRQPELLTHESGATRTWSHRRGSRGRRIFRGTPGLVGTEATLTWGSSLASTVAGTAGSSLPWRPVHRAAELTGLSGEGLRTWGQAKGKPSHRCVHQDLYSDHSSIHQAVLLSDHF